MSADYAHRLQGERENERTTARSIRVRAILALGPVTALAGIAWAVVQPWRLTLLHPAAQGFWWLISEPPIYVVLAGVLFRLFLAPGIVQDVEEAER
jgi:hypothetical protein